MKVRIGEIGLHLQKYPYIYIIINYLWKYAQYSLRTIFILMRVANIKQNKIVISNIHGRGYSDHPKYILEEINQQPHGWDIVWILNGSCTESELPHNIRTVQENSLKSFYELATAKLWIDNAEKRLFVLKRNGQYYLQTWHGFGPKKNIDKESTAGNRVETHFKHNAKMIDAYVSNNDMLTKFYRDEFHYEGEVLKIGFPRNDILINEESPVIREKVFSKYSLSPDTKVVLYAPTYRPNTNLEIYHIDCDGILSSLEKKYGGVWICLLRLHPVIARLSSSLQTDAKRVIDASNYLDMQELLLVSDVLITDYSSCMFDFALTKRPCLLYHPDILEYENSRGFSIPPKELPFPAFHSSEELIYGITTFNYEEYIQNINSFYDACNMYEPGDASRKAVEWITERMRL